MELNEKQDGSTMERKEQAVTAAPAQVLVGSSLAQDGALTGAVQLGHTEVAICRTMNIFQQIAEQRTVNTVCTRIQTETHWMLPEFACGGPLLQQGLLKITRLWTFSSASMDSAGESWQAFQSRSNVTVA